jgi:TatD DNase family protein
MSFRYIDVHTHVNLDAFNEDFREVAEHTHDEGVAYINVGTGKDTSLRAVELIDVSNGVYATVGVHPVRAGGDHDDDESGPEIEFDYALYKSMGEKEGVVAIGECGFDYFRVLKDTKPRQERGFIEQIELANELGKPLMLHIRDVKGSMEAYEDAIAVLKAHAKVLGNVHFFAGTYDIAKQFWDMGYTTSFTGVITFAKEYDEVIRNAPLEMLHAETDAPYVAPVPFRGHRNEPLHVREVYRKIADIRGQDLPAGEAGAEETRIQLLKNAERLFGVSLS